MHLLGEVHGGVVEVLAERDAAVQVARRRHVRVLQVPLRDEVERVVGPLRGGGGNSAALKTT